MSLFKDVLRKTQKSVLRKLVLKEEPVIAHELFYSVSILDGGALLHRVRWLKDCTFNDVFMIYLSKIQKFNKLSFSMVMEETVVGLRKYQHILEIKPHIFCVIRMTNTSKIIQHL